jgi:hypothetical protein
MEDEKIELVENTEDIQKTAKDDCPLVMRDKSANAEAVENVMDQVSFEK